MTLLQVRYNGEVGARLPRLHLLTFLESQLDDGSDITDRLKRDNSEYYLMIEVASSPVVFLSQVEDTETREG